MSQDDSSSLLRPEQVASFARGLYFLASTDGIDEREVAIIREFLDETGHADLFDSLSSAALDFDPALAAEIFETSFLQRVFLKTAVVLVRADGVLSDAELARIRDIAAAFGQEEHLTALLAETEGMSLTD